jgi:hypothetical protein
MDGVFVCLVRCLLTICCTTTALSETGWGRHRRCIRESVGGWLGSVAADGGQILLLTHTSDTRHTTRHPHPQQDNDADGDGLADAGNWDGGYDDGGGGDFGGGDGGD